MAFLDVPQVPMRYLSCAGRDPPSELRYTPLTAI